MILKLIEHFFPCFRETNVYKAHKQFMCYVNDKMDKQKGF